MKEEPKIEVTYPFTSPAFMRQWDIWKAYKAAEFKFKYKTAYSEQAALKKLARLAQGDEQTAIDIIDQSMADRWEGLYTLKKDGTKKSTTPGGSAGRQYQGLDATGAKLFEDIQRLATQRDSDTSGQGSGCEAD